MIFLFNPICQIWLFYDCKKTILFYCVHAHVCQASLESYGRIMAIKYRSDNFNSKQWILYCVACCVGVVLQLHLIYALRNQTKWFSKLMQEKFTKKIVRNRYWECSHSVFVVYEDVFCKCFRRCTDVYEGMRACKISKCVYCLKTNIMLINLKLMKAFRIMALKPINGLFIPQKM